MSKPVAYTEVFVQRLDGQMRGTCFPVRPKVQIGDAKAVRARNASMAKIKVVKNLGDQNKEKLIMSAETWPTKYIA